MADATTEAEHTALQAVEPAARVVAEEATEKVMVPTDRGMEAAVVAMVLTEGEVEAMVLTEGEMEAMEEVMVPTEGEMVTEGGMEAMAEDMAGETEATVAVTVPTEGEMVITEEAMVPVVGEMEATEPEVTVALTEVLATVTKME